MKKKLLLLIFSISFFAKAQITFHKSYDYFANSAIQTSDSGYMISGISGLWVPVMIKTDANGDTIWTRTFSGSRPFSKMVVLQTYDGGFIVHGIFGNPGTSRDYFILKTDSIGNLLWNKILGDSISIIADVVQTPDSGFFFVGGNFDGTTAGNFYMIKTDLNGDTLWTKTLGALNSEGAICVALTSDGGYLVGGYSQSFGYPLSALLVKLDSTGNTVWLKYFADLWPNGASLWCNSIIQSSDGGYMIAGSHNRVQNVGEAFLLKLDVNGNKQWFKTYTNQQFSEAKDVLQTSDGGYIISGRTGTSSGFSYNGYLVNVDSLGNVRWSKTFADTMQFDYIIGNYTIQQTFDNGYIFAGWQSIIKTDSEGNIGCSANNVVTVVDSVPITPTSFSDPTNIPSMHFTSENLTQGGGAEISTYCFDIVSVAEKNSQTEIILFPNPFSSELHIHFQRSQTSTGLLRIFNSIGETVLEKEIKLEDQNFNLTSLPMGIYFLIIKYGDEISTQKILKQ